MRPIRLLMCSIVSIVFWGATAPVCLAVAPQDAEGLFVGGYFAWYKIALIGIAYLVWVVLADRASATLLRFGDDIKMSPELWNPVLLGSFLLGFALVAFVPIFWVGLPLFLLAAYLPILFFKLQFSSKLKTNDVVKFKLRPDDVVVAQRLEQDQGIEMKFVAAGDTDQEKKRAMILARQSPDFQTMKNLIANILAKRADMLMLDCKSQGVDVRMQVDGAWHPMPPMERAMGDNILASLKYLSGLRPEERRAKQQGSFRLQYPLLNLKTALEVTSQGVSSGERTLVKVLKAATKDFKAEDLGLAPERIVNLTSVFKNKGLIIISAPPSEGLTTTWRSLLLSTDRFTRDCIVVMNKSERDSDIENLVPKIIGDGENPAPTIRKALMAQPQMIVMPDVVNRETFDLLVDQVIDAERTVVTRTRASSAAEALLRLYAKCGDRDAMAKAVTLVTCQRLIRRLCTDCRVPVPIKPEMVQKLGGDPRKTQHIYKAYVPPPPELSVDEKGEPIEIPVCPNCQGLGYIGRAAILESMAVNDSIRAALKKQPKLPVVAQIAKKSGQLDMMQEAYRLVLDGVTSVDEVKRIFQDKP